jgi:hypothetical protein
MTENGNRIIAGLKEAGIEYRIQGDLIMLPRGPCAECGANELVRIDATSAWIHLSPGGGRCCGQSYRPRNPHTNGRRGAPSTSKLDDETLAIAARDDEPPRVAAIRSAVPPARTLRLADVEPAHVEWLWHARIPRGMVTLIDGEPKLGKSTLTLDLAARVTTGSPMPGDTELARRSPANVILMTAEDHLAVTIRPRLDAAGADATRVHALVAMPKPKEPDAPPMLTPDDITRLAAVIVEHTATLVVIDPLMAYLPGDVDAYRDQDVRRVLRALAAVAERTGAAIVIVRHLRKGAGSALHRGGGSIGIAGAARSVLFVGVDPDDADARVIAVSGMNLARPAPALRWRFVPAGDVARVEWFGVAEGVTADDLAALPEPKDRLTQADEPDAIDEAVDALRSLLATGPKPSKEVELDAREMTGASPRTLKRARKKLGVRATKTADGWFASLPDSAKHASWY